MRCYPAEGMRHWHMPNDLTFLTMVEVFKTNVADALDAHVLLHHIHQAFMHYKANFDLDDCDRILRVKCSAGFVDPVLIINLIKELGFQAEVLPDEPATASLPLKIYRRKQEWQS